MSVAEYDAEASSRLPRERGTQTGRPANSALISMSMDRGPFLQHFEFSFELQLVRRKEFHPAFDRRRGTCALFGQDITEVGHLPAHLGEPEFHAFHIVRNRTQLLVCSRMGFSDDAAHNFRSNLALRAIGDHGPWTMDHGLWTYYQPGNHTTPVRPPRSTC